MNVRFLADVVLSDGVERKLYKAGEVHCLSGNLSSVCERALKGGYAVPEEKNLPPQNKRKTPTKRT